MPFLLTLIVGAAAGFLAVRFMDVKASVVMSIGIGVLGAVLGSLVLRALVVTFAGASTVLSLFVGGLIGAIALIWLYKRFFGK